MAVWAVGTVENQRNDVSCPVTAHCCQLNELEIDIEAWN